MCHRSPQTGGRMWPILRSISHRSWSYEGTPRFFNDWNAISDTTFRRTAFSNPQTGDRVWTILSSISHRSWSYEGTPRFFNDRNAIS
ncbi:unnamed protein product, partial [Laminaria digitata]